MRCLEDFEKSFGDFLERREYDRAENALFSMVRISFRAGWLAAGGKPPRPQQVFELLRPGRPVPADDEGAETGLDFTDD